MDVDALIQGMVLHPNTVAENRTTGEGTAHIHRQYADRLVLLPIGGDEPIDQCALPGSGISGDADRMGTAAAVSQLPKDLPARRIAGLQQGDGPRDGANTAGLYVFRQAIRTSHLFSYRTL